jgi:UDP-glucose 4-epimerase
MKVLVTGGTGYIGSHTIIDLVENNFDVVCLDNLSRSSIAQLKGIEAYLNNPIPFYNIDLCDLDKLEKVFENEKNIEAIIHFAAYKTVNESVLFPTLYFDNNLISTNNILKCIQKYNVKHFIFSSSCSVYGNATTMPVTEETPFSKAQSPYALTKQMGEQMIEASKNTTGCSNIILRYFNPAGAHPSNKIGENQGDKPTNLLPVICAFAKGKIPSLPIYGTDYDTKDGTCLRDYFHVCDLANAHTKALQYAQENHGVYEVFNVGSGNGATVLEIVKAFEEENNLKLNYTLSPKRAGDVGKIYATTTKANILLAWKPKFTVKDIVTTAWAWENK